MNRSDTIGELAAALAKAQGQMSNASKDTANTYFKSRYADMSSIVDAIKKPLAENGIAYVQTTDIDEAGVIVETTLLHTSGEWLSGLLRMRPVKDDPQGIGSCITYARRYGLQAIVGLAADDDDGNAASGHQPAATTTAKSVSPASKPAPAQPAPVSPASEVAPAVDDAAQRKALITSIDTNRQLLMLTMPQLNKDAETKDGVSNWNHASTPYLEALSKRLQGQVEEKRKVAQTP